jgi:hypothetical protein
MRHSLAVYNVDDIDRLLAALGRRFRDRQSELISRYREADIARAHSGDTNRPRLHPEWIWVRLAFHCPRQGSAHTASRPLSSERKYNQWPLGDHSGCHTL